MIASHRNKYPSAAFLSYQFTGCFESGPFAPASFASIFCPLSSPQDSSQKYACNSCCRLQRFSSWAGLNFKGVNFSNIITHRPVIFHINQWALHSASAEHQRRILQTLQTELVLPENIALLKYREWGEKKSRLCCFYMLLASFLQDNLWTKPKDKTSIPACRWFAPRGFPARQGLPGHPHGTTRAITRSTTG